MNIWYIVRTSSAGLDANSTRVEVDTVEDAIEAVRGMPYASISEFEDGWLTKEDFYYPRHPKGVRGTWAR